jgi:hypothetical protein
LLPLFSGVAAAAVVVFGVLWLGFWYPRRRVETFYFDPQDALQDDFHRRFRTFPKSAETATFEPMLKNYVGVTQLLVTVAAASIAFGGSNQNLGFAIQIAKLLLAWSIFYGVLFCALLLWRYDEYAQNVRSYTLGWYSTIIGLGFSCLICFVVGYFFWGFGLIASASPPPVLWMP